MPRGPSGERRPAQTVQCAHRVFQIAIGEAADPTPSEGKRRSGAAGAAARMKPLDTATRSEIAWKAARVRWK
jgi:hypothetical protein